MTAIEKIVFPERVDKIKEVNRTKPIKSSRSNKILGIVVEMYNGDSFQHYSKDSKELDLFEAEKELIYVMVKTKEGDNKPKNRLKSYSFVKQKQKSVKKTKGYFPMVKALRGMKPTEFLFIDIEAVPLVEELDPKSDLFTSWEYKRRKEGEHMVQEIRKSFDRMAPLYAEFGKIVCISIGMIVGDEVKIHSYHGEEKELLKTFADVIEKFYERNPKLMLCGHSVIGYDLPFMMRRMIINGIPVPDCLDFTTCKPWEMTDRVVDIAQIWKNTGFYGASLINMAVALDVPSPKDDIDGSMVGKTYYKEKDGPKRVVQYCEKDVFATINIVQKLYNSDIFTKFASENQ